LGSQKYVYFGKEYHLKDVKTPADIEVESIKQIFDENGFNVIIGG
jgi:hypothetical protein